MTLPPCCPYQPRRSVSPHQSLATIHAAFARKVRARHSGCSTLEAIWVHLRYGPVARLPSLRDGFVNRLQDYQFPSFLLFKLRGSGLLPRWDSHPLFMPAFAGRTLLIPKHHTMPNSMTSAADLLAVEGASFWYSRSLPIKSRQYTG